MNTRTPLVLAVSTPVILLSVVTLGQFQERAKAPTVEVPREGCVTPECHPEIKAFEHLHGPVHVNACESCHAMEDASTHRFELSRPDGEMCSFCHELSLPADWVVHEPVLTGACLGCHDPHGSASAAMLRAGSYAEVCVSCHEDVRGQGMSVHGPASAGACGACHEPHAAPHTGLLLERGRALCLSCHVGTGIQIDTSEVVHEPLHGECSVCHDPHASDQEPVLLAEPSEMCVGCHRDISEAIEGATTQHGAISMKEACLNCHTAHASTHERLLRREAMSLCLDCHDREIELEDGSTLRNIKAVIETGTSLHGPVAERNCVACHEIHGGGHQRLLVREYPSDLYYPFSESAYALCFSCHDKQLALLSQTATATGFRNGQQNLHYVHVNRDKKGRTCRTCHDSHAANRDHHIRDSIPFGKDGWRLPIGYRRTENGGACEAGCHRAYEYNRLDPVALPDASDDESWKGEGLRPGRDEAQTEQDEKR